MNDCLKFDSQKGYYDGAVWASIIRGSIIGLGVIVFIGGPFFWIASGTERNTWIFGHVLAAAVILIHSYATLVFVRQCSRTFYSNEDAKRQLHSQVRYRMWLIRWVMELADFGWLLRARALACMLIVVLSAVLLTGRGPAAWVRFSSAIVLLASFGAGMYAWITSVFELGLNRGGQLLRRVYLGAIGVVPLPGDRWCDDHVGLRPRCFLSYHREDCNYAKELCTRLRAAGISVEMYDPENLWADAPEDITRRIEQDADCIVYGGAPRTRSRWVRAELAWASKLGRPVFVHHHRTRDEVTIESVYRSARVPRRRMGEHFIISAQDEVFRTYLPRSVVRASRALQRTSGLTFMRGLDYAEVWDKYGDLFEAMRGYNAFVRRCWRVLLALSLLGATVSWCFLRNTPRILVCGVFAVSVALAVTKTSLFVSLRRRVRRFGQAWRWP